MSILLEKGLLTQGGLMQDVREIIKEKGVWEGMRKGRQEGIEEGIKRVYEKGKKQSF